MKELIGKGHKTTYKYMKARGYDLYDCEETENGYEAEWYISHAGVTIKKIIIVFNKNWRVIGIK